MFPASNLFSSQDRVPVEMMELTQEQQKIVCHESGHSRVSAVAGSGKTTTMVERVGFLLKKGILAQHIMVLMFNRSARNSFEHALNTRFSRQLGKLPEIRTFHSLGMRLVQSFTKRGALPGCRLVTDDHTFEMMAKRVVTQVYQEQGGGAGEVRYLSPEDIEEFIEFIELVKASAKDQVEVFAESGLPKRLAFFPKAFEAFELLRQGEQVRFFSDLISDPLCAMNNDEELVSWVENRVDHIIVDEYQDINEVQQQLLKIVAGSRAEVMVVGDVDQCIYEWRGAKPDYIVSRFQQDFKSPDTYKLSYTFRYGHQLSLAANHVIDKNRKRDDKLCVSHCSNAKTTLETALEDAGNPVVSAVQKWQSQGRLLGDAVVLVRLFAAAVPVELALLEAGIPYRLEGGNNIFQCHEILALCGYLSLVSGDFMKMDHPVQHQHLISMLSQPHPGLGKVEFDRLVETLLTDMSSASSLLSEWSEHDFPHFIKKRLADSAQTWSWLLETDGDQVAAPLLRRLVEKLKLYEFYHNFSARAANAENRVKTCEAFIEFAASKNLTVRTLLDRLDDYRADLLQREEAGGSGDDRDRLLITSIHRAKGLEWPLVILPGLNEGTFPFYKENGKFEDVEDERRLFYVAITRAVEQLVCCHPNDTSLNDAIKRKSSSQTTSCGTASRFLYEANFGLSTELGRLLDREGTLGSAESREKNSVKAADVSVAGRYLKAVGNNSVDLIETSDKKKSAVSCQDDFANQATTYLALHQITGGMTVFHPKFGRGKVSEIQDRKQGRIKVVFDDAGEMILLVSYAKLTTG